MDKESLIKKARTLFADSMETKRRLVEAGHLEVLADMAQVIRQSLANGGKLLLCGNGGSAADAQHLAAELLVRLRPHVNRDAIPALALATDTSSITACGNDYSYEVYFQRMTSALGRAGDVLLGLSTSGKSSNVILALQEGRRRGLHTLGFLGGDGGPMLAVCDLALVVPSTVTGRIQESHITAGHALMEMVEELLLESHVITAK